MSVDHSTLHYSSNSNQSLSQTKDTQTIGDIKQIIKNMNCLHIVSPFTGVYKTRMIESVVLTACIVLSNYLEFKLPGPEQISK